MELSSPSAINSVRPFCAVEGGRITIDGINLSSEVKSVPEVHLGTKIARVVHASKNSVSVVVPQGLGGGRTAIKVIGMTGETAFVDVGIPVAMGLHQVDSPAIGVDGSIYLTFSGSRGESMPVSVYRVRSDGFREPFVSGITNPTSMTLDQMGNYIYQVGLKVRCIKYNRTDHMKFLLPILALRAVWPLAQMVRCM